jgi:uncharacterized protein
MVIIIIYERIRFMVDYKDFDSSMCMGRMGGLRVNGVGTVKVMADMAVVSLGIVTEDLSLKAAQEENAEKANAVLKNLYAMGIQKNQVRTKSYNIEPIYNYVEGRQIFEGYRVSNILSVNIRDLTEVGNVIDNATANGANRVENINFTVIDTSKYVDQALSLAIKDAVRKSSVIGDTLGVKVDMTPIRIVEEGPGAALDENPMFKLAASSTPILPGQIDVIVRITAIFEYI